MEHSSRQQCIPTHQRHEYSYHFYSPGELQLCCAQQAADRVSRFLLRPHPVAVPVREVLQRPGTQTAHASGPKQPRPHHRLQHPERPGVYAENVCNNTDKYNAAIACSLNLTKACTAKEFMALLPDPNNLQTIQNIMCANLAQLEHLCTVNKTSALFKCSQDKYGTMTVADAYDPYISTCTSYDHAEECLEEEIQECGQANLDLRKQFNQLQKPPACMTTTTSPIGK